MACCLIGSDKNWLISYISIAFILKYKYILIYSRYIL
jgi:hypothetical protein